MLVVDTNGLLPGSACSSLIKLFTCRGRNATLTSWFMFPCEGRAAAKPSLKTAATSKEILVGLLVVAAAEHTTMFSTKSGVRVKTSVMYCLMYTHVLSLANAKFSKVTEPVVGEYVAPNGDA